MVGAESPIPFHRRRCLDRVHARMVSTHHRRCCKPDLAQYGRASAVGRRHGTVRRRPRQQRRGPDVARLLLRDARLVRRDNAVAGRLLQRILPRIGSFLTARHRNGSHAPARRSARLLLSGEPGSVGAFPRNRAGNVGPGLPLDTAESPCLSLLAPCPGARILARRGRGLLERRGFSLEDSHRDHHVYDRGVRRNDPLEPVLDVGAIVRSCG